MTIDDVKCVLFEMSLHKASGVDGYLATFF